MLRYAHHRIGGAEEQLRTRRRRVVAHHEFTAFLEGERGVPRQGAQKKVMLPVNRHDVEPLPAHERYEPGECNQVPQTMLGKRMNGESQLPEPVVGP